MPFHLTLQVPVERRLAARLLRIESMLSDTEAAISRPLAGLDEIDRELEVIRGLAFPPPQTPRYSPVSLRLPFLPLLYEF